MPVGVSIKIRAARGVIALQRSERRSAPSTPLRATTTQRRQVCGRLRREHYRLSASPHQPEDSADTKEHETKTEDDRVFVPSDHGSEGNTLGTVSRDQEETDSHGAQHHV